MIINGFRDGEGLVDEGDIAVNVEAAAADPGDCGCGGGGGGEGEFSLTHRVAVVAGTAAILWATNKLLTKIFG